MSRQTLLPFSFILIFRSEGFGSWGFLGLLLNNWLRFDLLDISFTLTNCLHYELPDKLIHINELSPF